jgi:hypothetical protein
MMRAIGAAFAAVALSCAAHEHEAEPVKEASETKDTIDLGDRVRVAASAIVLCKTTEAEVRAAMGGARPFRDGRVHAGRVLSWVATSSPERFLAVLVDDHGIIVDLIWDAPGAVSWDPRSQCGSAPP